MVLLVVVLAILLLLQLPIVQKVVHGNSATATTALKCSGNSATATKLQTARKIEISGAVKGNANFDGSQNMVIDVSQNNITTITGQMTINGKTSGTDFATSNVQIDFPSGFNRENCVVLAFGTRSNTNLGYTYGRLDSDSSMGLATLYAAGPKGVTLGGINASANKIIVHGSNYSNDAIVFYYKIVLMKI